MIATPELLALALVIVFAAYFVFGATGFGSSLLAVPLLSQLAPLAFVLPLVLALDLVASAQIRAVAPAPPDRGELLRTLLPMAAGTAAGVLLLGAMPEAILLALLGAITLGWGLRMLRPAGVHAPAPIGRGWAWPAGGAAGLMGAAFGVPGPPYVMYLSRRIFDKSTFHATIASALGLHFLLRTGVFAAAGLYAQPGIVHAIAWLLPASVLGAWTGMRVQREVPATRFFRWVALLLAGIGAALLVRVGAAAWPANG